MAEKEHAPPERYALYYPYIHITDENWLKGTILAFQQVRRIVPMQFTVRDQAITKPYAELRGADGSPLLRPVFISADQIRESQEWLRLKIQARIDELKARYSVETAPLQWQGGPEAFQIHVGKFLAPDLLTLLTTNSLAWYSREPGKPGSLDWVTMHPTLAAAVMSILALSVARLEGLCVVTPSARAHHALLANDEERAFEKLLDVPVPPGAAGADEVMVEELAHVVITTGFDLTRLTPPQICELLKEGKDLRAFRRALSGFVSRIPAGLGPAERLSRLKKEAQSVLDEWADYTAILPSFAKEALVDSALDKAPDFIKEGMANGAFATIGSLPTLMISVAVSAGASMFRKRDTPLRFLSRVNRAVSGSLGSIYVPQWRALANQAAI